jgi:hypothetical protein
MHHPASSSKPRRSRDRGFSFEVASCVDDPHGVQSFFRGERGRLQSCVRSVDAVFVSSLPSTISAGRGLISRSTSDSRRGGQASLDRLGDRRCHHVFHSRKLAPRAVQHHSGTRRSGQYRERQRPILSLR